MCRQLPAATGIPAVGEQRVRRDQAWQAWARGLARTYWQYASAVATLVFASWLYLGYA